MINPIKSLLRWVFATELKTIQDEAKAIQDEARTAKEMLKQIDNKSKMLTNILGNIDVSVDVHEYSRSWAVISIQGEKSDYIKFVDLGKAEIREIERFISQFDRRKIDANPQLSRYLKFTS